MIWDEDTTKFLELYYGVIPNKDMAYILETTIDSIKNKAYRNNFHKNKCRSSNKCWQGCGIIPGEYFGNIKRRARNDNIPFFITIEYIYKVLLKQKCRCALTGDLLFFNSKRKVYDGTASLDRIDPTIGYCPNNVWWTRKDINMMRHTRCIPDFINTCIDVAIYSLSL